MRRRCSATARAIELRRSRRLCCVLAAPPRDDRNESRRNGEPRAHSLAALNCRRLDVTSAPWDRRRPRWTMLRCARWFQHASRACAHTRGVFDKSNCSSVMSVLFKIQIALQLHYRRAVTLQGPAQSAQPSAYTVQRSVSLLSMAFIRTFYRTPNKIK